MPQLKFRLEAAGCLVVLLLSGIALATSNPDNSPRVVVPDFGNNRVLIYNHPVANGQRADVVLGQSGFTTKTWATTQTTMYAPSAYAVDKNGNLYVSDSGNCRVLQFRPPFSDGQAANAVIGQPDFNTTCGGAASASVTASVSGVAIDKSGALWVADTGNNRVLRFKAPFTPGKAADIVIGQTDFVSNGCATPPTAASLCSPRGLDFDSSGVLYVADSMNNRILGFKTLKKGASATVELGHPAATAFTSNTADDGGASASSLAGPFGIGIDSKNRIWVADSMNSRVVRFDSKFHNGDPAVLVLGQADFTQTFANQNLGTATAATLNSPQGIYVRNSGDVWVGDTANNRNLRFLSTFKNGMDSIMVLGQPDFTHNQVNQGNADPSDETENNPFGAVPLIAGPSLIALTVLGGLAGGRRWLQRFKMRA
jgi:sugar lactone lactonase YvrE